MILTTLHASLADVQSDYLKSRGYTDDLIQREDVFGVPTQDFDVLGRQIRECEGCVGWIARSMSGQVVGVQTRELEEKKYRWHQFDNTEHLPMLYGSQNDWDILWETGVMFLTEGPFDRIAVKRALPDRAVFARLSKGISNQMISLIKRYVKHLWLAFDVDQEGEQAVEKSEEKLGDIISVYRLTFPFKDPSQVLERRGLDFLEALLKKQILMQSLE